MKIIDNRIDKGGSTRPKAISRRGIGVAHARSYPLFEFQCPPLSKDSGERDFVFHPRNSTRGVPGVVNIHRPFSFIEINPLTNKLLLRRQSTKITIATVFPSKRNDNATMSSVNIERA